MGALFYQSVPPGERWSLLAPFVLHTFRSIPYTPHLIWRLYPMPTFLVRFFCFDTAGIVNCHFLLLNFCSLVSSAEEMMHLPRIKLYTALGSTQSNNRISTKKVCPSILPSANLTYHPAGRGEFV